jgi:hypothetical protein
MTKQERGEAWRKLARKDETGRIKKDGRKLTKKDESGRRGSWE